MSGAAPCEEPLVIGLGNPDCGDDGIGPLVAARLAGLRAGTDVIQRRGDALAMLQDWDGRNTVVVIDAAAPVSQAGAIHRIDLAAGDLPRALARPSTHAFSLADAVALARAVGSLPRHLIVYAVEGCAFQPGASMSQAVAAVADEVARRIAGDLLASNRRDRVPPP